MSFGLSRQPITRGYLIDIEPSATPGTGDPSTVIAVRFTQDLLSEGSAAEFPVGQLDVGVTRVADNQVGITVTANPWEPERVPAGLYKGSLEVRGPGISTTVPASIHLDSRESGGHLAWGIGMVTGGATLGLLLKFITERLTPQASMLRRLSAFKQAIGYRDDGETVPTSLRLRVEELEDHIARQDLARVEQSFEALDHDKVRLAPLVVLFDALLDSLEGQDQLIRDVRSLRESDKVLPRAALEAEYRFIRRIQAIPWPEDEQLMREEAARAAEYFPVVHDLMFNYTQNLRDQALQQALRKFQQSDFEDGRLIYEQWLTANATVTPSRAEGDEVHGPAPDQERTARLISLALGAKKHSVSPLFRYARLFAGVGSVIVVALVGLKTQYLDQQAFRGELTMWLSLGLWGAAVELSGVSVLDVLGRLGSNGASTTLKAKV